MIHRTDDESQCALFEEPSRTTTSTKRRRAAGDSPQPADFGLTAPSQLVKNYVLDTNVLLHDPASLERFKENHLCIPVDVLAELDKFKSEQTERGANARRVHRRLTEMFSSAGKVTQGVTNSFGGTVRMVIYDPASCPKDSELLNRFHRIFPDRERVDHRILAACLLLMQHNTAPVVLVTKDINMQLKARAVGIECQDYLNDKVDAREVSNYEVRRIEVDPNELQRFASSGDRSFRREHRGRGDQRICVAWARAKNKPSPRAFSADGRFVRLNFPEVLKIPDGQSLKPLNLGQRCLIDALLNPEISLVTCYGHAGTGKTLVAVAAGLHEMFNRRYTGITVSRPVVAMGEQLGFLPGSLDEKMRPWLQPIHDALDLLMRPSTPLGPRRKQQKATTNATPVSVKKTLRNPHGAGHPGNRSPLLHPRPLDSQPLLHPR
jgi:PhoH-like ATPase